MIQQPNLYLMHCDACGYHKVVKPSEIPENHITRVGIQKNINVSEETVKKPLQFKCPQCGRGITLNRYKVPLSKEENNDKENHDSGRKTSTPGREISPKFTG